MPTMIIPPTARPVHERPRRASPSLSWSSLSPAERDLLAVRVPLTGGGHLVLPIGPSGLLLVPAGYALAPIARQTGGRDA
jgi:hypothetical protein